MKIRTITAMPALVISGFAMADVTLETLQIDIVGNTNEQAVKRFLDVKAGQTFATEADLIAALEFELQDLKNRRYFESAEYTVTTSDSENFQVVYTLDDQFSILPLPYVIYDSNVGLEAGFEGYYNNAFGQMADWYLNANFQYDGSDEERPLGQWGIQTRISNIKLGSNTYSISLSHKHKEEKETDADEILIQDLAYDESAFSIGTSFQLPASMSYSITPGVNWKRNYQDYIDAAAAPAESLSLTLGQSIGKGRTNWVGNFREGRSGSVGYDLGLVRSQGESSWTQSLSADAKVYVLFGDALNYYAKAIAKTYFGDEQTGLGSNLRGVADASMSGSSVLALNNSVAFNLLNWTNVLNIQLHPFVDIGTSYKENSGFDALRAGAGGDAVFFLDFLGGFSIRTTVGFDVTGGGASPEVIVTTGLAY